MREYRGKWIDTGEWVYGYLFMHWGRAYILWGMTNGVPNMIEVDPSTVGQQIGMKDNGGKGEEIYLGDIFPATERTRGEVTIVCYDSRQARYKAVPLSLYHANAGNGGWTGFEVNPYSTKVGNIHDNPELLEVSKCVQ